MGIELLPARDPRRSDRARSRDIKKLVLRAFSASLVVSGLLGPRVGRQIDRVGGRHVLCASNVVLAAGLALLGASMSVWTMSMAWLLLGIGMGLGLYDAAFGTLGCTQQASEFVAQPAARTGCCEPHDHRFSRYQRKRPGRVAFFRVWRTYRRATRSRHHTKGKQRFVVSVVAYVSLPGHQTELFHAGVIVALQRAPRGRPADKSGLRADICGLGPLFGQARPPVLDMQAGCRGRAACGRRSIWQANVRALSTGK
ncbi:hypothetical protein ACVW1C_004816 [Bradyrhizobium sp. USDA 4011]